MSPEGTNQMAPLAGPDQTILADLEAPVKSFRLFALEQAIAHGRSRELLAALERMQATEQDEECLCLIAHAIEAVRSRLEPGGEDPTGSARGPVRPSSDEDPVAALRQGTVNDRIAALLRLTPAQVRAALPWAVEALPQETNHALISMMLRTFGRLWPKDRLDPVLALADSPFIAIRCGAIETVGGRDPRRLTDYLPRLLQDPDPRVVAGAVKALAGFDPEEARGYLDAGLRSIDPLRRQAMLRVAVVLPFEITRGPLLNCLAVARDPEVIEKAGLIVQVNPDPDVPFRLLELLMRADAARAPLLEKIFTGACQAIKDSEILGDAFPAWLARIKQAVAEREAARRRQIALSVQADEGESGALSTPPPARSPAPIVSSGSTPPASPTIGGGGAPPEERMALPDLADLPCQPSPSVLASKPAPPAAAASTPRARNQGAPAAPASAPAPEGPASPAALASSGPLSPSLAAASSLEAPTPPPTPSGMPLSENRTAPIDPARFAALPTERQVACLDELAEADGVSVSHLLRSLLIGAQVDKTVREAALRAATRLGIGDFVAQATPWLHGKDEGLVAAALEYLGLFDAEKIIPMLGAFHASPSLKVRLAAMKVLSAHDPEQAVSLVIALLKSANPRHKSSAAACLMSFDFALVREPLVDHLETTRDLGVLETVLTLFKSHPDPDNLFLLFRLSKCFAGEAAAQVQAASEAVQAQIRDLQLMTPDALARLLETFPKRWEETQARKAAPPPYARSRRPGAPVAAAPAPNPSASVSVSAARPPGASPAAPSPAPDDFDLREAILQGVAIGLGMLGVLWFFFLR